MPQLTIDAQTISYTLRVSRRAKRLQMRMTPEDGLVVVLPAGLDVSLVGPFLETHREWIRRHAERHDHWRAQRGPETLADGARVLFRGEPQVVRLATLPRPNARSRVAHRDGVIILTVASAEEARPVLERWMRQRAREAVLEEIARFDADGRFPHRSICLRDQKTRWGSCSRRGTLSFNWRLIMAPPEVLRYVVAHELAHTRQPNHSARFWRLVRKLYGDYEPMRRWLREEGGGLR